MEDWTPISFPLDREVGIMLAASRVEVMLYDTRIVTLIAWKNHNGSRARVSRDGKAFTVHQGQVMAVRTSHWEKALDDRQVHTGTGTPPAS